MRRFLLVSVLLLACRASALKLEAQEAVTAPVLVHADRLPSADEGAPFSARVVTAEELRTAPQARLDDILRAQVPGFSLFRRSSSRVANPTTQGVTLRNFGPSGAGRTLVLLDGIPLNDPFAGYVLWNQIPPASLENVLVASGGGAGLYGNAALAGTIFLVSREPAESSGAVEGLIGNHGTYDGTAAGTLVAKPASVTVFAERFATSGYPVLQRDQRGPVDNNASSDSELVTLRLAVAVTRESTVAVDGRAFHEERGNGTIYTANDTSGADASVRWVTRFEQVRGELRLSGWVQRRRYRSTFSAINAARTIETPSLNQFNVPAAAVGGSAVWSMALGAAHVATIGADVRSVDGETNEAFSFVRTDYTRQRTAGGEQLFAGAFAEDTWHAAQAVTIVGSARVDHWELTNGSRIETDRATGATTLALRYADRSGDTMNGRLGASIDAGRSVTVRAAGYTGFRVPTLNELYRPFRVGNAVTEANAALRPERLEGGEAAVEWRPAAGLRLSGTAFYNRLEDAIGNITVGRGPGTFEPVGFLPAGGVLRQRQNIQLVTAPGAEMTAEWQVAAPLRLRVGYLFTRPTIAEASEAALRGKLLAQTPEHVATAAVDWKPISKLLLTLQTRYNAGQFEDDQNRIELAPFFVIDLAAQRQFTARFSGALKVENLLNADIETGKSPDGLVSSGAPRLVSLQLRWEM
ncbi:MAG: TonB-dependent receptor [Verrucomicrobiota bacterium]|nr:TonB-dependent receptor [Verrucomicrobiota bacterium]